MTRSIFFLFLLQLLSLPSCKKESKSANEPKCTGGSGGNLTMKVFLQHHEHQVANLKNYRDTVYIKYNTLDMPGKDSSFYDATYIGEWPGDSVVIPNLHCGNYYLYSVAFESLHSVRVTGGTPFSTGQTDGEVKVTIAVSE